MFDLSEKIKDTINDEISPFLKQLNKRKKWNNESKKNLKNLIQILERKKYKFFIGHPSRYHLTKIGDSCLYDVPTYRKGVLAEFRGKRIRLICISSGRYDRHLMAGIVSETPISKIKIKEKIQYVFPDIGDHEIAYLGRRYMLINSKGHSPIELHQGSFDSIDLDSCDLILLDGKECCPIATLTFGNNKLLSGNLLGRTNKENYRSIVEAIKGLAKQSQQYKLFLEKF
jgi:hypothetical protein